MCDKRCNRNNAQRSPRQLHTLLVKKSPACASMLYNEWLNQTIIDGNSFVACSTLSGRKTLQVNRSLEPIQTSWNYFVLFSCFNPYWDTKRSPCCDNLWLHALIKCQILIHRRNSPNSPTFKKIMELAETPQIFEISSAWKFFLSPLLPTRFISFFFTVSSTFCKLSWYVSPIFHILLIDFNAFVFFNTIKHQNRFLDIAIFENCCISVWNTLWRYTVVTFAKIKVWNKATTFISKQMQHSNNVAIHAYNAANFLETLRCSTKYKTKKVHSKFLCKTDDHMATPSKNDKEAKLIRDGK